MITPLLALVSLAAAPLSTEGSETIPPPPLHGGTPTASYLLIPPAARALDFQQAFEMLRREKTTGKVFFELTDGSIIPNVIEMTLLPNSTLFIFRFNSQQGIRFQVVKVEEILNISYSP